jgi:predicted dehydrogenase
LFQDRLQRCREKIQERTGKEIPEEQCFTGLDAYQKLLETDIDIMIQATPPYFRAEHFEAAVQARKHVFMEKPVAVDPVGVRSIMATAEKADAFNLCVVTGTQFRHMQSFIETYNRVVDGAIGELRAARGYSLRGQLWYREPREEWSELEAMLRDWVNWTWLSGDHIVEQHIHGIDVLFWFTGGFPVTAIGTGGRARRVTGDQYDFFSFDYELENGLHINSMCRQIDGCKNEISRWVIGSDGFTNCQDTIFAPDGTIVWQYEPAEDENSPYVQEHIDLITAIRSGNRVNEAAETARSTLGAIMARESAYSGLEVAWEELMESDMKLGPETLEFGPPVDIPKEVPVPGTAKDA